MTLVGCDLHSRSQQLADLDAETGEVRELRLPHDTDAVERCYTSLPRPVTIGVESNDYAQWFHALIQRQGHTLLVGDAARIRAMVVRKTKTPPTGCSCSRRIASRSSGRPIPASATYARSWPFACGSSGCGNRSGLFRPERAWWPEWAAAGVTVRSRHAGPRHTRA